MKNFYAMQIFYTQCIRKNAALAVYFIDLSGCVFHSILGHQRNYFEAVAKHGWQILFVHGVGIDYGDFRSYDLRHVQELSVAILLLGFGIDGVSVCVHVQKSDRHRRGGLLEANDGIALARDGIIENGRGENDQRASEVDCKHLGAKAQERYRCH